MNRKEADALYEDNWCHKVKSIKEANTVIRNLAKAGAYTAVIESDTFSNLLDIGCELKKKGFDVEPYNGSNQVLEISWG